jgi:DNA-binding response OmpR family regulator/DNA-binding CsgD family transcriptional regulator
MTAAPARILVVDDTPANLALLLDALAEAGHAVSVAESARSALSVIEHLSPELILLDLVMPGMDGIELCGRLRSHPRCRDVPVLFMTAVDEPEQKVRALAAGAIDYITKPVYPPEVLARVSAHLQIRALRRSLEEELALRVEAEHQLSQALDRALVLADRSGRIVFATRLANSLLHRHFRGWDGTVLPKGLAAPAGPLRVRRFAEAGQDDLESLILEERATRAGPAALLTLGLTPREAEVLFWIAEGKGNAEIAVILGASVRTIHKHVENLFRKLGCESRNAATVIALEVLRGPLAF